MPEPILLKIQSNRLQILLVVQLSPVHPGAHLHNPSVCRHVSGLQLGEHSREQFMPKYPSLQAKNKVQNILMISKNKFPN